MSSESEKIWLENLAAGSRDAFTNIYNCYWESMLLTAAKVLRSPDDACDVVQEVFLSLWNRRSEMVNIGSLGAYLHTSVKYKSIHFIEKNIHKRDYLALLNETAVHYLQEDPDSALQLKQLTEVINNVVEGMPPKMQAVYKLSRNHHLTHRQIAEQLGISQETVKKHIQHALEIIKIAIKDLGIQISILGLLKFF